jgi:hypothetical protein
VTSVCRRYALLTPLPLSRPPSLPPSLSPACPVPRTSSSWLSGSERWGRSSSIAPVRRIRTRVGRGGGRVGGREKGCNSLHGHEGEGNEGGRGKGVSHLRE